MTKRLHHVQILCPPGGEDAARNFFGRVLGLMEIHRPTTLRSGGVWFALDDGRQIHVGVMREGDEPSRSRAHFAIQVDDLEALKARLRREQIPFTTPDDIPGWSRLQTRDPFGNGIEILQIQDESGGPA